MTLLLPEMGEGHLGAGWLLGDSAGPSNLCINLIALACLVIVVRAMRPASASDESAEPPARRVRLEVQLLPTSEGGRQHSASLKDASWRPHLRVTPGSELLGITFWSGPD